MPPLVVVEVVVVVVFVFVSGVPHDDYSLTARSFLFFYININNITSTQPSKDPRCHCQQKIAGERFVGSTVEREN